MRAPRRMLILGLALVAGLQASAALASSSNGQPALLGPAEVVAFAGQVQRELAAHGARVAMVFRTGRPRDQLPDGVAYTHGALWIYQDLRRPDGTIVQGYAVHNLYHYDDDRRRSYLLQDFPVDFLLPAAEGDVGIIIPTLDVQRRLYENMAAGVNAGLHNPDYSIVSNPADLRFQNCNEYLLDLLTASIYDTTDRRRIKAIHRQHFRGQRLKVGPFARLFGPMFDERVRLEDHDGAIVTVTFASLATYLEENGMLQAQFRIHREPLPVQPEQLALDRTANARVP